ncbi:MAG: flagellar basal body-associated FliL family protein, partial [Opitutales bacterium]
NMEGIRTMLLDFQKALGSELSDDLDLPPLDMQIPGLGLSIDEVLSAFSGEITAALINLPDHDAPHPQSDVPEFVLALSTVDPASKVYQDILKKKLLSLFDKGLRQELLEQTGISLVAKDNRLIIGSHGQAAVLKAGKAPKPVGSDERKLLSGGYLNLHVDAEPIAKAMEKEFGRNRRGIDHGLKGEMEYLETQLSEDSNLSPAEADSIVGNIAALREELARMSSNSRPLRPEEQFTVDAFKRMEGFTLQATKQGETYLAEVALSLNDTKSNFLKQTGAFIGNFMDPAWRDPEMRPRIEATRKLAAKDPEAFRESLVGAWKDEWEDEWEVETASESNGSFEEAPEPEPQMRRIHGVNKYLNRADGTLLSQQLAIEPEGYYLDEGEGRWAVHGNSLLEYDEHGLLEWVGGLLEVTPEKHDFYSIGEPFREYDVLSNPRVPLDWQLPDPPKGLPKLEREIYDEDRDFDVLLPQSRRELDLIEESAGENLVVRQEGTPPKSYEIQELITNLSGPVKTRFLSVDLVAQGTAPNFEKVMEENDFRIRHEALKVLGGYKYEDTQQDAFMERVNVDLMKRFASVLQKHSRGGRNFITKLYFTEFVVQ